MSAFDRVRARLFACAALVVALGALALAPAAGASGPGSTYLALGDSLAYGYHAAQFQNELKEKGFVEAANFNDGYVDDFGATLKLLNPKLTIVNDGCPGETTDTMIKGSGVGGAYCAGGPTGTPFPKAFLHHSYPGTQLQTLWRSPKNRESGRSPSTSAPTTSCSSSAPPAASRRRSPARKNRSRPRSATSSPISARSSGSCGRRIRKRRSSSSPSTTPTRRC